MAVKTEIIQDGDAFQVRALHVPKQASTDTHCPTIKFFSEINKSNKTELAKLLALLKRTAEHGPPQIETKFKHLRDEIYEFKTHGGLRLLAFFDENFLVICTHGFHKKQQKTPPEQITRALTLRAVYMEAKISKELTHE